MRNLYPGLDKGPQFESSLGVDVSLRGAFSLLFAFVAIMAAAASRIPAANASGLKALMVVLTVAAICCVDVGERHMLRTFTTRARTAAATGRARVVMWLHPSPVSPAILAACDEVAAFAVTSPEGLHIVAAWAAWWRRHDRRNGATYADHLQTSLRRAIDNPFAPTDPPPDDAARYGHTAVLSLRPDYARWIEAGMKTVEVRRRRIRTNTTHILVYTTKPVGMVTALVEVTAVHTGTPDELWNTYGHRTWLAREEFDTYLAGLDEACLIELGDVTLLPPMRITDASGVLRAPQCVQYLRPAQARLVGRHVREVGHAA